MKTEEKIIFGVLFVALLATLLHMSKSSNAAPIVVNGSQEPESPALIIPRAIKKAPEYLRYNAPWLFAPPIGSPLPRIANYAGQTVNPGMSYLDPVTGESDYYGE